MDRNESKAPLVLMEQVIMVLVFALVAALCIQAFVLARTLSVRMTDRDRAMNVSQTLAETVKACGGDTEEVREKLGGETDGERLLFFYDGEWKASDQADASFLMVFEKEEGTGFCKNGRITVSDASGEQEISSLHIAWQGEKADE
ncbi:MAG: hypothetical protein PUK75_12275 [bacterium]|nr:hypothetical protein [bacterium]MDY4101201.1 hypothetical protein [Lachnospiraceae bacterium]